MAVREDNMAARRERILAAARAIIASEGFDALTTRRLADAAGVAAPTLYNLIGSKDAIIRVLMRDGAQRVLDSVLAAGPGNTIEQLEAVVDRGIALNSSDPDYFRALWACVDRIPGGFAPNPTAGADAAPAGTALAIVLPVLARAEAAGELLGTVSIGELTEQMFYCYRGPVRDWASGAIALEDARRRVTRGFLLVLAADAGPDLRGAVLARLASLVSAASQAA